MRLHNANADMFIPDGLSEDQALGRTTHMGIGAHQDDLEFITFHAILECFGRDDRWYTGVVVTDGAGSARTGMYARYSDDEMRGIRRIEQRKAAVVGEYAALLQLDYTSSATKDGSNSDVTDDLAAVLGAARPSIVYTHNPADKHDTHVSVAIRAIEAMRRLPADARPRAVYGCEAWRDLDWMCDGEKLLQDVAAHENLSEALMGIFDSQISGGKRYDIATIGRRRANATYLESHSADTSTAFIYAMDLTPLIQDPSIDITEYTLAYIHRFAEDVSSRIARLR